MANYSFKNSDELPEGKNFLESNFCQLEPNTPIFTGISGLTFVRCNLTNCTIPADAITESCLRVQMSFCTNLRPDLMDYGLPECDVECAHMIRKDEIWIDGNLIETVYEYSDTKVA